jgi:5-methylthioadenosine/S-adenosylhomocysteine deaminase
VNSPVATSGARAREDEFVVRSAYVLTMDSTIGDLPSGDVHVRGDKIAAVAPHIDAPNVRTIDGTTGMILMPGLIDAHTHFWTSQMRGHFACSADQIYFKTRNRLADGYRAEDIYEGATGSDGAIITITAGEIPTTPFRL